MRKFEEVALRLEMLATPVMGFNMGGMGRGRGATLIKPAASTLLGISEGSILEPVV
jgi:hypothetical protein